jgi:hypothetical protein
MAASKAARVPPNMSQEQNLIDSANLLKVRGGFTLDGLLGGFFSRQECLMAGWEQDTVPLNETVSGRQSLAEPSLTYAGP